MKAKSKNEIRHTFKSVDSDSIYGTRILKSSIVDYTIINGQIEVKIGNYYALFSIEDFFEKFDKID